MKKWILFVATILVLCSSVARAGDFEDATEAYQKGNYAKAIELLRPLATQGYADAQYNLGQTFLYGQGVAQDYQEAANWFRLAAEQGFATAQNNIGAMYIEGKGVTQNHVRAYMWLSLAASNEDKSAKINLGELAKEMPPSQIAEAQKMARDCEKQNYKNCE